MRHRETEHRATLRTPAQSALRIALPALAIALPGCTSTRSADRDRADATAAAPRIVIDGDFDDWRDTPAVSDADDAGAGVDFLELSAVADGEAIYVRFATDASVVLQQLGAPARLLVDLDGSAVTGASADGLDGVDLVVAWTAGIDAWSGGGVAVRVPGGSLQPADDVGYVSAPTHASDAFELRIDRRSAAVFAGRSDGDRMRVRLAADAPDGRTADVTSTLTFRVPPAPSAAASPGTVGVPPDAVAAPSDENQLARAPGTLLRVIAWNVADAGIRLRPEAFARILRGLDPDVILLDELPRGIDEDELRAFLARTGGEWNVALGEGGGRQRAAVTSRLPLQPARAFTRVAYPDSVRALAPLATFGQTRRDLATAEEDGIPAAGAIVETDGARILFIALDLACCGGQDDVEDRLRRIQADAIRAAAARTIAAERVDAVVAGGDFNLVGSRRPLEILQAGLDPAGGDLEPARALQLDGRTAATWRSRGPFPPGRLDWLLFSPGSLEVARAFAFETADVGEAALARAGIEAEDSERTSDHLPLVLDLRRRR